MSHFDTLILGAGASGLYCAAHLAREKSVGVLDHGAKAARKVRVSGGGRCNFTNLETSAGSFLSMNPHFVKSALARHTPWDVVSFFMGHGLTYSEKAAGQLFCEEGAGKVAGTLLDQAKKRGAQLFLDEQIEKVELGDNPRFTVHGRGKKWTADTLVLALGGPSWPQAGGSYFAFELAREWGLSVIKPMPALVGLVLQEERLCRNLAGTALPVAIRCGERRFVDDLLFTHTGISGPAVLQISSYWEKEQEVEIDLLPTQNIIETLDAERGCKVHLRNYLCQHLPKRICASLIPDSLGQIPVNQLSHAHKKELHTLLHSFKCIPRTTEGWKKAEVCRGGIDTAHFSSKTFACKDVEGLYAIGECLDVTGQLGGYNLQWAWSSAHGCAEALATS